MHRRRYLSLVSTTAIAAVAGCNTPSGDESPTEGSPNSPLPESDTPPEETPPADETPERQFNEELLVELYEFGAYLRAAGDQHFDDGLSHWNADNYLQASRRFTAAEQKYESGVEALRRVTTRLAEEGLAGFAVADDAQTHTDLMQSAARNYVQAAVSAADGEQTTADSYRESAENFRTRAENYEFAPVSEFQAQLRTSR